jgi:hypothetical protein
MNNVIVSTGYKLAQSVVANGQITGNPWQNPQNVFLSDGLFATSNSAESAASDFIVGNFAMGIPSDAVITGFLIKILGKQGAQTVPPLTLTISAVDNTSGPEVFYPYTAPYTGLNPNNEEHILGGANYLFDTTWTADQANNIKLAFQANGDISLDSVSVNALYYVPGAAPSPDPLPAGCEDCNSVIQVQKMTLKVAFKVTDTEFIIAPGAFAYADGTPVQPGDLGSCGGEIDFVFDQGLRKPIDGNFAENVVFFSDTGSWVVLGDGSTKFTLGSFTDRGRQFHEPYGHDANLVSGHAANSEVVISNNGRFYSRFVRRCQEDIVFSPPITVQDEGSDVVSALHTLNFRGPNVQAEQDSGDTHQANVDILANPTNVSPTVEDSNEGTTGTTPATSISIPLTIVAANYLRIWISSQDEATPTVTFDGVPATIIGSETHGSADLKAFLFDLVSPNAGTHNVVITFANAINFSAGAVSFLDVDISNPVDGISAGTSGNGTAPTDTLTTTIQNTLAQDVVAVMSNPTTFTQGALWTIQGQVNAASYPGASSTRKVLIPGTVTDTYSILPTGNWVLLLAGVRGNTAASSSDEKVKVTSSDTTPGYLGAKLNIHSSDSSVNVVKTTTNPGGNEISDYDLTVIAGGSLEVQENGVSVETGVTKINILSNSPIVTNPATGEIDIDMTGFGSGIVSGGRQYIFDDFTASHIVTNSTASDFRYSSGNFFFDTLAQNITEFNHPGVIVVDDTSVGLSGFISNTGGGSGGNLGRLFDADFDVIVYSRVNYGGSLSRAGTIGIVGNNGNEVSINFDLTASANYSYGVNGSSTTSSEAIPVSGTYVEHRFLYENGTLTIYVGSTILYTGAVTFNNATTDARSTKVVVGRTGTNSGTFEIATDWVKTWSALTPTNGVVSGTTISATAEQDLTAGQPVGLSASLDDKVALALLKNQLNTTSTAFTAINNIVEIDTDKYVICCNSTGGSVWFVAQIDRTTMTITTLLADTASEQDAYAAKLDTNKFAVVQYNGGPQTITDKVFTVSGITATNIGSNNYGSTSTSGPLTSITSAGTDRLVYTRIDGFTPTGTKMVAITYVGGTGSAGSAVTLDGSSISRYKVNYVDTDTILSVQNQTGGGSPSTSIPCTIYTVTGNSFGSGTGTSVGTTGSTTSRGTSVSVVSPGVFLLRAQRTTSPVFSNLYLCHLSGASIVTDQTSTTDADGTGNLTSIGVSGKVYETCYTGVTATNRINEITVSGTSFTKKIASIGLLCAESPLITLDSTNGYYYATNRSTGSEISTNIQGMSNNFIGIAQSTVSRGATVNVLIKGVDTHQSGLSAGNTYIVSNGAFVISGDPTLPNKGIATSPTSIEI